jgi:VWFA-related protein
MRIKHVLVAAIFCLFAVTLLQSQSASAPNGEIKFASQPYVPQDTNAIRVKATMVDVNVVVRDSHGQAISGLTRDDFEIYDQGKKQKITLFTPELAHPPVVEVAAPKTTAEAPAIPPAPAPATPPRYLGLYFDDINMTMSELVFVRKATETFVRDSMDETDRVAVFTSSAAVTQQFTSNKQQLLDAIGKVLSHTHITASGCPIMTPYEAYEIGLFSREHNDALDLAVTENREHLCCARDCVEYVLTSAQNVLFQNEIYAQDTLGVLGDVIRYMEKMPGRRSLVMASGGYLSVTNQVLQAQDKMIANAIHAGIIVSTLGAKGLTADYDYSQGMEVFKRASSKNAFASLLNIMEKQASDDGLSSIAQGTGGKFFHDNNDMVTGLRQMAELPAASYILAFSPDEVKDDGLFHSLKVKVPARRDVKISARPGYFALTREQAAPAAKLQRLDKEVLASDILTELTAEVVTESARLGSGESGLKVAVHVPGHSLLFKKENKGHNERVIFITALFDMQNHYLAGTEAVMDMRLKDATFTQIARDGVNAKATLQLPPGRYRLRQVVQEVVGGRMATIDREVEIRDVSVTPRHAPLSNALE